MVWFVSVTFGPNVAEIQIPFKSSPSHLNLDASLVVSSCDIVGINDGESVCTFDGSSVFIFEGASVCIMVGVSDGSLFSLGELDIACVGRLITFI